MHVLVRTALLSALGLGVTGTAAAEWTKTYVIEWYEPAHYYGAREGVTDPGTDCPAGSNPEPDWEKILVKAGYTVQEAKWLLDPSHPFRIPNHGQNQRAFRGENKVNVYVNPESGPDPGLTGVSGKISEGLDLDGDKTNGFTSPEGETGIDNEFYRTIGCWIYFRGPPRMAVNGQSRNGEMRDGLWTVVMVVSGEGDDPMNDPRVKVGFYNSKDAMIKDGVGNIARRYTFRIAPDAKFEGILNAKTVNGEIISTEPTEEMWIRDPSYAREAQIFQAQTRLKMQPDGSLTGVLAGYRPWQRFYQGMVEARGSVIEQLYWIELPGLYRALKRNADYSPTGPGGEKTHISFALRIDAVPAYVMTPDAKSQVTSVESYKSVAPLPGPPLHAFITNKYRVTDGLVPDPRTGKILAGPNAVIPPPASMASATNSTGGSDPAAGGGAP
jgi:hypothetical protein